MPPPPKKKRNIKELSRLPIRNFSEKLTQFFQHYNPNTIVSFAKPVSYFFLLLWVSFNPTQKRVFQNQTSWTSSECVWVKYNSDVKMFINKEKLSKNLWKLGLDTCT